MAGRAVHFLFENEISNAQLSHLRNRTEFVPASYPFANTRLAETNLGLDDALLAD